MLNSVATFPTLAAALTWPIVPAICESASDPTFAVIDRLTEAYKAASEVFCALQEAEIVAAKKFGKRPSTGIRWRDYSHISGTELDVAREDFLARGIDPETVQAEYNDAKGREQVAERNHLDWYREAGLLDQYLMNKRAWAQAHEIQGQLENVKPTTIAGAAALLEYVVQELKDFEADDWHFDVFDTVLCVLRGTQTSAAA